MQETSFLIRPTEAYRESYLAALREGFNFTSSEPLGSTAIDLIEADFTRYLHTLDHSGQNARELPQSRIPQRSLQQFLACR